MAKRGRPSKYTKEVENTICRALADGKSLRSICQAPGMPDVSVVIKWLWDGRHEEFCANYARAREQQAELWAEQIVDLANTPLIGERTRTTERGVETVLCDNVERSKLMIDARKWVAAKLLPKKYGDRLQAEHSGAIGVQLIHDIPRPKRDGIV